MQKTCFLLILLTVKLFAFASNPIQDLIRSAGDAGTYPNDNLVVVFDSTRVDVKESGLSYIRTHALYKVLNYKGALDVTVLKFGYDPLSAYSDIKEVIIYKNDGTITNLDMKAVHDYPAPAHMIYWGAREKMIEVGRLDPGDAVEVVQNKKGFTYALLAGDGDDEDKYIPPMKGHFYDIVDFWAGNPEKIKVYQVSLPLDKHLQFQVYNGELQTSSWISGDNIIYSFSKKDVQPFHAESRMVATSDVAPKLLLSTSPDWQLKSTWFFKVNEE